MRLALPQPPAPPQPSSFPMLATCAPVLGSAALWFLTQSPFALVFALLGPIIAIASLGDGRIARRRTQRVEAARFEAECTALAERIDTAQREESAALVRAARDARAIASAGANDPHRWRWEPSAPLLATVGTGLVASAVSIEPYAQLVDDAVAERTRPLLERAERVEGPIVVDGRLGLGCVGPDPVAAAMARSLVLQLLAHMSPATTSIVASGAARWAWLESLPHDVVLEEGADRIRLLSDEADCTIAIASDRARVPRDCRILLECELDAVRVDGGEPCVPTLVSDAEAVHAARVLADGAAAAGIRTSAGALPERVELDALPQRAAGGLAATFLMSDAPHAVDLVADGPHAVVGGTTGSGKSELLIAWIAALAATHPPSQLAVLLVDFKGGASFGALTELTHCVGVITDLDAAGAQRAIESLRAELRHRERVLAADGARSIDDSDALPRLVIVVDEFAAMLQELPDLHRLFVDIAARGRSLGVHLILCTQRPADAVRDAVLANCGLRISLRVNDDADSLAVTGVVDAARIPLERRGRCVVQVSGRGVVHAQSAIASPAHVRALVAASASHARPRRPWCDPLPERVARSAVPAVRGIPLGLVDRPAQQRVDATAWEPESGCLLALGAASSGKSVLARVIAQHPGAQLVIDEEALWDALDEPITPGILVVDDLDLLLARAGDEHGHELAARLMRRMREGASLGHAIALTARRITTGMTHIAALADQRIVLRMASRQEHVLAGGATSTFDDALPPGAGWRGDERIQIMLADGEIAPREPARRALECSRAAVVLGTHAALPASLAHLDAVAPLPGATADLVVGSPAQWEAAWGVLETLAADRPVLFLGIDERQLRQLHRAAPVPPVVRGERRWMLEAGRLHRLA